MDWKSLYHGMEQETLSKIWQCKKKIVDAVSNNGGIYFDGQ